MSANTDVPQEVSTARSRRPWSRKLNPMQIRAVINDYHGGLNVRDLMAKYQIGRTAIYRYLHDYDKMPDVHHDVGYWRIEVQRLKELVIELALKNKELTARLQQSNEFRAPHAS